MKHHNPIACHRVEQSAKDAPWEPISDLTQSSYKRRLERRPAAERAAQNLSLSEHRDRMVLRWLCEQFAARYDHIELLLGIGIGPVGELVSRLRKASWVRTSKLLVAERMWVLPTRVGMRRCDLPYAAVTLGNMSLGHVAAVNDVRLRIQSLTPQADWICERQLILEGAHSQYVPDGVVLYDGRRLAIEVELNSKATDRVRTKLGQLQADFDGIVYFCAPGPHRQLTRLAQSGRWPELYVRELPRRVPSRRL